MSFYKPQNNQKQFLKKVKQKQQEDARRKKKELASDKLTSVIRKYLSNKRYIAPIIKQADEKIQAILLKKRQVDQEKFTRMMSNALFKMPIIMAPLCFVSFETLPAYFKYVLRLAQAMTMNVENSNMIIRKLLQGDSVRSMQFLKMAQFSFLLSSENSQCHQFLKEFIITSKQNQGYQNLIDKIITQRTILPLKRLILSAQLSSNYQQIFLNQILLEHLNRFSKHLSAIQIFKIILSNNNFTVFVLEKFMQMISKNDTLSPQIYTFVRSRTVPDLRVLYDQSLSFLKRLPYVSGEVFSKALQIHQLTLSTYFSQTFNSLMNKMYGKKMLVEDLEQINERKSRVRKSKQYRQFLNNIDINLYFGSLFQLLKQLIHQRDNETLLYNLCELYLLLEDIFRKTHTKMFSLLTDINLVTAFYQLIRPLDYNKIDFRKRSKMSVFFQFFIIVTYHKFVEMDDAQFSDPAHSFNKATLEQLIKVLLKLVIMLISKSITGSIFQYTTFLINDIYKKVFRTKLINLKIFESQHLDKLLQNFNATKKENTDVQLLLKTIPFGFSFEARLLKLRQFIKKDKTKFNRNLGFDQNYDQDHTIQIRRGQQFNDAFHQLAKREMRQKYRIVYINQQGIQEEGVDGGGIIKELINQIIKVAFNPIYGLFLETTNKQIIPNPHSNAQNMKQELEFIGKLVGKALYENILIEPKFSGPFLNIMMGKENCFEDLQYIDKSLYKSLLNIKHTQENISESFITFSIEQTDITGKAKTIQLKENGKDIFVTDQNKLQFVLAYADYKVNRQFYRQGKIFRKGFTEIIQEEWLQMFNYEEINLMISGNSSDINIYDLMENTVYTGYEPKDLTVRYFWEVLHEMSLEDKGLFLHYTTSCSRPPTLGFKELKPKFCISKSSQSTEYLPTVHTCMNLIKLPDYKNKQKLKQKLLYAIHAKAGFDVI